MAKTRAEIDAWLDDMERLIDEPCSCESYFNHRCSRCERLARIGGLDDPAVGEVQVSRLINRRAGGDETVYGDAT